MCILFTASYISYSYVYNIMSIISRSVGCYNGIPGNLLSNSVTILSQKEADHLLSEVGSRLLYNVVLLWMHYILALGVARVVGPSSLVHNTTLELT